jgi:hypothetical protein
LKQEKLSAVFYLSYNILKQEKLPAARQFSGEIEVDPKVGTSGVAGRISSGTFRFSRKRSIQVEDQAAGGERKTRFGR